MTAAFSHFLEFARHQRWALFFYLSILIHLALIVHMAIKGTYATEKEYCNLPQVIQLSAQVTPPPSQSEGGEDGEEKGHGAPMGPHGSAGKGEFADEYGIDKGRWKEQLDRTEEGEALAEAFGPKDENQSTSNKDVTQEYINRKRDYRNIIAKDIFPTLKTIDKPFHEDIVEAPRELEKYIERNEIIENYRLWREGRLIPDKVRTKVRVNTKEATTRGRLSLDEKARKKYFDETLEIAKETQLSNFLRDYGEFDPNEGDLPRFVRELYYENLQRIAPQFNQDKTYFAIDYYHEALNKEDFLRKALAVVSKKKGTKYATEILFAIENIYEIQAHALDLLFTVKNQIEKMRPEEKNNIRIQTLEKVIQRYIPLAASKGIQNSEQAFQHYYLKRVEVLEYLLAQTPENYRAKDAMFLKGRVFWSSAKVQDSRSWPASNRAVDIWKQIAHLSDSGDFIHRELWEKMQDPMKDYTSRVSPQAGQIDMLLHQHMNKIVAAKLERENRLLWSDKSKTKSLAKEK